MQPCPPRWRVEGPVESKLDPPWTTERVPVPLPPPPPSTWEIERSLPQRPFRGTWDTSQHRRDHSGDYLSRRNAAMYLPAPHNIPLPSSSEQSSSTSDFNRGSPSTESGFGTSMTHGIPAHSSWVYAQDVHRGAPFVLNATAPAFPMPGSRTPADVRSAMGHPSTPQFVPHSHTLPWNSLSPAPVAPKVQLPVVSTSDAVSKRPRKLAVRLPDETWKCYRTDPSELLGRCGRNPCRTPLQFRAKAERLIDIQNDRNRLSDADVRSRPPHFDEIKLLELPPAIDIYLPGKMAWLELWEALTEVTASRQKEESEPCFPGYHFDHPRSTNLSPFAGYAQGSSLSGGTDHPRSRLKEVFGKFIHSNAESGGVPFRVSPHTLARSAIARRQSLQMGRLVPSVTSQLVDTPHSDISRPAPGSNIVAAAMNSISLQRPTLDALSRGFGAPELFKAQDTSHRDEAMHSEDFSTHQRDGKRGSREREVDIITNPSEEEPEQDSPDVTHDWSHTAASKSPRRRDPKRRDFRSFSHKDGYEGSDDDDYSDATDQVQSERHVLRHRHQPVFAVDGHTRQGKFSRTSSQRAEIIFPAPEQTSVHWGLDPLTLVDSSILATRRMTPPRQQPSRSSDLNGLLFTPDLDKLASEDVYSPDGPRSPVSDIATPEGPPELMPSVGTRLTSRPEVKRHISPARQQTQPFELEDQSPSVGRHYQLTNPDLPSPAPANLTIKEADHPFTPQLPEVTLRLSSPSSLTREPQVQSPSDRPSRRPLPPVPLTIVHQTNKTESETHEHHSTCPRFISQNATAQRRRIDQSQLQSDRVESMEEGQVPEQYSPTTLSVLPVPLPSPPLSSLAQRHVSGASIDQDRPDSVDIALPSASRRMSQAQPLEQHDVHDSLSTYEAAESTGERDDLQATVNESSLLHHLPNLNEDSAQPLCRRRREDFEVPGTAASTVLSAKLDAILDRLLACQTRPQEHVDLSLASLLSVTSGVRSEVERAFNAAKLSRPLPTSAYNHEAFVEILDQFEKRFSARMESFYGASQPLTRSPLDVDELVQRISAAISDRMVEKEDLASLRLCSSSAVLQNELEQCRAEIEKLIAERERRVAEMMEQKDRMVEAMQQASKLVEERNTIGELCQLAREELVAAREELVLLREQLEQKDDRVFELTQALQESPNLEAQAAQTDELQATCEKLAEENTALKAQVYLGETRQAAALAETNAYRDRFAQLEVDLDTMKSAVQRELDDTAQSMLELSRENDELRAQRDDMQREMSQLLEAMEQLYEPDEQLEEELDAAVAARTTSTGDRVQQSESEEIDAAVTTPLTSTFPRLSVRVAALTKDVQEQDSLARSPDGLGGSQESESSVEPESGPENLSAPTAASVSPSATECVENHENDESGYWSVA